MNKIIIDKRLSPDLIADLKKCIGQKLLTVEFEKCRTSFPISSPHFYGSGLCQLVFTNTDNSSNSRLIVEMKSTMEETPPLVDQGGFNLSVYERSLPSLKEKLKRQQSGRKKMNCYISYLHPSPIQSLSIYGNQEEGYLDEIYSEDKYSIKQEYRDAIPYLECNSIEFIIFEHKDGFRSVFTSNEYEIGVNLLSQETLKELIPKSYLKINGYLKNVVLQHEIS